MTLLPIVGRELRAAGRLTFTYYLRVLGAAAVIAMSAIFALESGFEANSGGRLFANLHLILFWSIWILAPWLTADCISRERREGTLGLLFLTHLRGADIVIAKSVAQGIRALTLGVAVLPVMTIPFLLGGVGWREVVLSVVFNFEALCCALAAGLLASAWSTAWLRALALAVTVAAVFMVIMGLGTGWVLMSLVGPRVFGPRGIQVAPWAFNPTPYFLTAGFGFPGSSIHGWAQLLQLASNGKFLWTMGALVGGAFSFLGLVIAMAGAKTRRSWQQKPPSERKLWWQATFCTPVVWLGLFRRWMRRKLERNPIGWLEQRTWTGRLVTWGWLAVMIALYSAMINDRGFFREYHRLQAGMSWLLAGSVAMSAAGSFRRERVSGVLELLLVSPLGEAEILWGRLRGLWAQFLPSVGLLLGIWAYFSTFWHDTNEGGAIEYFITTFVTLPVIGLYYSLRCRNFIVAFVASVLIGLLTPMVLAAIWGLFRTLFFETDRLDPEITFVCGRAAVIQLVFAVWFWWRLGRRLRMRQFPLERAE